ncbi:uridine kinase [Cellulomonas endophytica]|uniref:uridine kinase n=1 Tax=Cellulomonas endophytica TaxID=2494735 RepID=UPI00196B0457|nr:uridine kinase [Cellulomonas endophytica]
MPGGPVTVTPLDAAHLRARLVDAVLAAAAAVPDGAHLRVAVDGAPATGPGALADALVEPLRAAGRPVLRVRAGDFLRPASVRLEHGPHDPDALLDDHLDARALEREVLTPLGPGGTGRHLPSLWDAARDRATRAPYRDAPPGAVLLLDGTFLLGRWLELDLVVHLAVRPATLARRTPPEEAWTLPAHARYAQETDPEAVADLVVRVDDPRRPALVEPADG